VSLYGAEQQQTAQHTAAQQTAVMNTAGNATAAGMDPRNNQVDGVVSEVDGDEGHSPDGVVSKAPSADLKRQAESAAERSGDKRPKVRSLVNAQPTCPLQHVDSGV
jgi:hypothetical protein